MTSYVSKAVWLQAGEVLFQHLIALSPVKAASALAEFGKEGREPDASYTSYTYMGRRHSEYPSIVRSQERRINMGPGRAGMGKLNLKLNSSYNYSYFWLMNLGFIISLIRQLIYITACDLDLFSMILIFILMIFHLGKKTSELLQLWMKQKSSFQKKISFVWNLTQSCDEKPALICRVRSTQLASIVYFGVQKEIVGMLSQRATR